MVSKRHKVFISYHHDEDQKYADYIRDLYGEKKAIIDKSMYEDMSHLATETILNKIRQEHLRDSTVTVVLVGKHTWGRKWIDWEIYASLRPYLDRTRNGLVGILLPNHSEKEFRLTDNIESGYAISLKWVDVDSKFIDTVHQAFNRRIRDDLIDNTRNLRERNASLEPKQYSSGGGDCFIATAVFGTPLAREIDILRKWRDFKQIKSWTGKKFIKNYYSYSPAFAQFIQCHMRIKKITRKIINLFIKLIQE